MSLDHSKIVASGKWLYEGLITCRVFIQQEDVWPAFYDPDDKEIDDIIMPCVSVWLENSLGGFTIQPDSYFNNVDEAKEAVEKRLPGLIKWDK